MHPPFSYVVTSHLANGKLQTFDTGTYAEASQVYVALLKHRSTLAITIRVWRVDNREHRADCIIDKKPDTTQQP